MFDNHDNETLPVSRPVLIVAVAAVLALIVSASTAQADPLRIATWNIATLDRDPGGTIYPNSKPRTLDDYTTLAAYARTLDADVVALQEIDGPEAARWVFDPAEYRFHCSDRASNQRTCFAIRRGIKWAPMSDFTALNIDEDSQRGHVRHGTVIDVEIAGHRIVLMSVHLKSGCFSGDWLSSRSKACQIIQRQIPLVASWLRQADDAGVPAIVLGDFNRRLNVADDPGRRELMGAVPGLMIATDRDSNGQSDCWADAPPPARHYPQYIDHIVFSPSAAPWLVTSSFQQMVYDPDDAHRWKRISDHCPILVQIAAPK